MVVGLLGHRGDPVHERDRAREVVELEVVLERVRALRPLAHTGSMRIVSLVPSATETLFALGLGDEVIAVTHECDHPREALELPKITRDVIGPGLPPDEIDRAVRELTAAGRAIYELDEHALHALQPDLIVTQALCAVCAVSYDDVRAVAERMRPSAAGDRARPAHGRGGPGRRPHARPGRRRQGRRRRARLLRREPDRPRAAGRRGRADRVPVAALEWLDPVFSRRPLDAADDRVRRRLRRARAARARRRETRSWEEVAAAAPEVVVVMPCGYDAERALEEAEAYADELEALGARRVVAVDAAAYFSRPGPRIVDGLELLAHILHPDRVPEAPGEVLELVLE